MNCIQEIKKRADRIIAYSRSLHPSVLEVAGLVTDDELREMRDSLLPGDDLDLLTHGLISADCPVCGAEETCLCQTVKHGAWGPLSRPHWQRVRLETIRRAARLRYAEIMVARNPPGMSEHDAARACASMFVRDGITEGDGPGEFEITDVDIDDDGQYFVTIQVTVSNLDVELASVGRHSDQEELAAIREEWRR